MSCRRANCRVTECGPRNNGREARETHITKTPPGPMPATHVRSGIAARAAILLALLATLPAKAFAQG